MNIGPHPSGASDKRILHIVGSLTDEVFSFLGPATRALEKSGHVQTVVVIDDKEQQHNLSRLEQSASLLRIPNIANPFRQWNAVLSACRFTMASRTLEALHVHGLLPCIVGSFAMRAVGVHAPIVYSPHGSRSLSTLKVAGQLAMLASRPFVKPADASAIVSVPSEAQSFERWKSADVVESPVDQAFFTVTRQEAHRPLIVSGGHQGSARGLEIFSQLAVLLSGEELNLEFHWLGSVDQVSQRKFAAADVVVLRGDNEQIRITELAAGWVYVAPWSTRGFPLFLVQGMAAGLPCVALDCEQHRAVIENGITGFLCASEQDMVRKIAELVDDPLLRAQVGKAAQLAAKERFNEVRFEKKLLAAYPANTP